MTLKITCIVLAALASVTLARRRSAAWRHYVLTAALAAAASLPLLSPLAPSWQIESAWLAGRLRQSPTPSAASPQEPSATSAVMVASEAAESGAATWPTDLGAALRGAWLIGAVAGLLVLVVGLVRLAWLAAGAEPVLSGPWLELAAKLGPECRVHRKVRILLSTHPTLLVTWGIWSPTILLPSGADTWKEDLIHVVLCHELAHIRRRDWPAQLLAETLRAVYWFNPVLWMASRRLRLESERACDDEVLSHGVDGPRYAAHLVDLVRTAGARRRAFASGYPAPAMARRSSLERRVTAMLTHDVDRSRPGRLARTMTITGVAAAAVFAAGLGLGGQTFATFSGSVADPMNNAIPQVTLVLTNEQTQAKHEVQSDTSGRFQFVGLPPGDYQLVAKYPGFRAFSGRLTVAAQHVERDLVLRVGTVQETITVSGDRTSPDEPPRLVTAPPRRESPGKPCTPSSAGGHIRPPMKVRDVRPVYSYSLRAAGVSGVVHLVARIAADGSVADLREAAPTNPGLRDAAMDAVRQWVFTPTLLNCVPVDVEMNVNVTFTLQ
ncbi:MAG TPA: M56 family metallopeptidase [Vicinamibacterales bacterium]|nr:M56 family metallopeptidase [Vicinamibacterales bacterium]